MSAVDEYRKDKVYLAEVCGAGTLEDLADAALAEMEAELEQKELVCTRLRTSWREDTASERDRADHLSACYRDMEEAKRLVSIERDDYKALLASAEDTMRHMAERGLV